MIIAPGQYTVFTNVCNPVDYLSPCDLACEKGSLRNYSYNSDNNLVVSNIPPNNPLPMCVCPFVLPYPYIWDKNLNGYFYNLTLFNGQKIEIVVTADSNRVNIKKIYFVNNAQAGQCLITLAPELQSVSNGGSSFGLVLGLSLGFGLLIMIMFSLSIGWWWRRKLIRKSQQNNTRNMFSSRLQFRT